MVDNANAAMTAAEQAQSSTFKFGNERTEAMFRLHKELLCSIRAIRRAETG